MTSLAFTLDPDAIVRFHDIFICLAKFSDTVALEAEPDLLRLSALNSTKTAFASFVCDREEFFQKYDFSVSRSNGYSFHGQGGDRFYCQILLKALLSVFRGKVDRGKETAIEACHVELHEDYHQTQCRLNIRMDCAMGVIKSYKLTYEPAAIQHAIFDPSSTTSKWSADPRYLKQIVDHFSASAEQLDLYGDDEQAVFTSFTKKITDGDELLKNPIHTSVAATKADFEEFSVEDNMHITINLKDFKAVVFHAETGMATITAHYTRPCKPMQLAYKIPGIKAEFTLMTRGEADPDDTPSSSRATMPQLSRRTAAPVSTTAQASTTDASFRAMTENTPMPPLPHEIGLYVRFMASESMEFDSLFVSQDDDRWDEIITNEEPQDILGWDATGQTPLEGTLRDAEPDFPKPKRRRNQTAEDDLGIPPTQRISQVRGMGLFD
ncbi:Rad9/DDC1 [Penicillium frequentans]|nr:Rad9/DDC1 [Penicillium glabrum]